MNFFNSVFQDDPDPPGTESESDSPKNSEANEDPEQSEPNDDGGWSFGGLMKTLDTKSESVIETYRRDLEEFGTGLKKEIEVAQGSLGNVGHAIDELGNTVLKGTAEIIAQGKESILAVGNESDSSDNNSSKSFSSKPYSRFDAQVRAVQGDLNTYSEEPGDSDDYKKWESEFSLDEKTEEMEKLLEENGDMKGLYKKVIPNMVDHDTFWFRYFYKVHKLKQAEDLRANLVKRAINQDDEEELSWDIDDEEENSEKVHEVTKEVSKLKPEGNVSGAMSGTAKDEVTTSESVTQESNASLKKDTDSEEKKKNDDEEIPESKQVFDATPPASDEASIQDSGKLKAPESDKAIPESDKSVPKSDKTVPESDKSVPESDKSVPESNKAVPESDKSVPFQDSAKPDKAASTSTQQPSEEDLGWDEIEDMSSIDDKETSRSGGSPNRAELRKRLSAAEEDEDLSWDIEDDEEESSSTKA